MSAHRAGSSAPKNNDPILQARSEENRRHVVFVHPAALLVAVPDGTIVQRTTVGDRLVISPAAVGSAADSSGVFYTLIFRGHHGQ